VTDLTLLVVGLVVIMVMCSGNEHEQCEGEVAAQDQSFVGEGSGRPVEQVRLVSTRAKDSGEEAMPLFLIPMSHNATQCQ
jgi:hypothetical protein